MMSHAALALTINFVTELSHMDMWEMFFLLLSLGENVPN